MDNIHFDDMRGSPPLPDGTFLLTLANDSAAPPPPVGYTMHISADPQSAVHLTAPGTPPGVEIFSPVGSSEYNSATNSCTHKITFNLTIFERGGLFQVSSHPTILMSRAHLRLIRSVSTLLCFPEHILIFIPFE
jgi:hypothetical protein